MDYKWYELYSNWIIVLVLLYKLNIVKFNLFPSVLSCLIGSILVMYSKHKNNIEMSSSYVIYVLILHSFTLFLVPFKFDRNDIIYNIILFGLYSVFIFQLKGKSVHNFYQNDVVYSNSNTSVINMLKDRRII